MADNRRHLNIVVVGRSGVGKSSLLNYAAGRPVFATGTGAPVTQTYFDSVTVPSHHPDIDYVLFDTKGIENLDTANWQAEIAGEIDRRDASANMYDWMHTVIYCISAGDKRIEDYDIEAIRALRTKCAVTVVLTKIDQVNDAELQALRDRLQRALGPSVPVVAVCNGAVTRRGEAPASGIDDVLRASFMGLWRKAAVKLPRTVQTNVLRFDISGTLMRDFAALLALISLVNGDERIVWPTADTATNLTGAKPGWLRALRSIGAEHYHRLAQKTGAEITVEKKTVTFNKPSDIVKLFADVPGTVSPAFAQQRLCQRSLEAWMPVFMQNVQEALRQLTDEVPLRYTAELQSAIDEIVHFYNDITGAHQPLVATDVGGLLTRLLKQADLASVRTALVSDVGRIRQSIQALNTPHVGHGRYASSLVTAYDSLHAHARSVAQSVTQSMVRTAEAVGAELSAYGNYCLAPVADHQAWFDALTASQRGPDGKLSAQAAAILQKVADHLHLNPQIPKS